MKSKKAAMEMSVGTIVTIVLLMTVLVLGIVLIQEIFFGAKDNIKEIDQSVKNEIKKLFTDDNTKKIVIYPETRKLKIEKGKSDSGFGLSIRNVKQESDKFSYEISVIEASCGLRFTEAEEYISLGQSRSNINLPAGAFMDNPIFVRFNIPETAPPCEIRYQVQVYHNGREPYTNPIDVDLEIQPE